MTVPQHHIPDQIMASYVAGSLAYPYAVVLACHIARCAECHARYMAHLDMGGAVLSSQPIEPVGNDCRSRMMAMLDEETSHATALSKPDLPPIYPDPLSAFFGNQGPKWKNLGFGSRQSILWRGDEGSLRLLYIPAGQAVPDHSHNGLELTLVLQGSFEDCHGRFEAGDIEISDDEDGEHQPIAGKEADCICLAATDAPLRFNAFIPRILQPILQI